MQKPNAAITAADPVGEPARERRDDARYQCHRRGDEPDLIAE